jgi:WhiB family transcriptional regulator, redox-sensing transcriptional regulator
MGVVRAAAGVEVPGAPPPARGSRTGSAHADTRTHKPAVSMARRVVGMVTPFPSAASSSSPPATARSRLNDATLKVWLVRQRSPPDQINPDPLLDPPCFDVSSRRSCRRAPGTPDSWSLNHRFKESRLMTWRNRSACRDENPELFFPIGSSLAAHRQIEWAKNVCHRCEVVEACLSWAMESGQDAGVSGGMSEDERHALRRRNDRARAAGRAAPSPPGGTDTAPRARPVTVSAQQEAAPTSGGLTAPGRRRPRR